MRLSIPILASLLLGGPLIAQTQDDAVRRELEELRRSQHELMKMLEAQHARIEDLESRLARQPETPVQPPPQQPPVQAPPPPSQPEEPTVRFVKWNELMAGGSTFKLYGVLRADAIYDDSRPNNTQTIAFIRSEDPNAPASIGAEDEAGDLTIHPRLTKLGLDFDGPVIDRLGGADVSGKIEIDFYNNGLLGQTESRQAVRLRHGWLKLSWTDLFVLAGQTNDVISPLYPIVNADLAMWGAGNLGDRRPQFRVEYKPNVGPGQLIVQGMVGLTGADDNQDLDSPGTFGAGYRDGETSQKPTLQARLAYRLPVWEKQGIELGGWYHHAWEEADIATGTRRRNEFDSQAYGLDLSVPIYKDVVSVKGEVWAGQNVDDVRGGIFQGINTVTGTEIRAVGGFVELGVKPVDWYSIHFGWATDDPRETDLNRGGRNKNEIWYVAHRFFFDPVEFGIEYLHWTTEYTGFGDGDDNRLAAFVSYKF